MNNLFNIFLGGFANWKTTLTSIIAAVVYLLHSLHVIDITPEVQTAFVTVTIFIFGFLTKDSNKTGTATDSDF